MTSITPQTLQFGFQAVQNNFYAKNGLQQFNNSTCAYAEKGDPTYQKEMDLDEDGIITFEEFKDYCLENDISLAEQRQMLENRLNYQIHKERTISSKTIREIKPKETNIYAKEGEKKYQEEIDENKDGKITYEEYIKYCENKNSETPQEKFPTTFEKNKESDSEKEIIISNPSKALSAYSKTESQENDNKIENEV